MSQDGQALLDKYGFDNYSALSDYIDSLKHYREIEKGFIKIADLLPDSVIIMDDRGIIQYCNDSALNMFHHRNLVGSPVTKLMPERYHSFHTESFGQSRNNNNVYSNEIKYYYGITSGEVEFPISISSVKYKKNEHYNYIAIIRDISNEYEKLDVLRDILEQFPVMVIVCNNAYLMEYSNNEFKKRVDLKDQSNVEEFISQGKWKNIEINSISMSWYSIEFGNKFLSIGMEQSKTEIMLRKAIDIVIEAKYGCTDS